MPIQKMCSKKYRTSRERVEELQGYKMDCNQLLVCFLAMYLIDKMSIHPEFDLSDVL